MKINKVKIAKVGLLVGLTAGILFPTLSGAIGLLALATIIEPAAKDFSATSGGYTFDCYILNDESESRTCAVAWGQSTYPNINELYIPDSFTNPENGKSYDVYAIQQGGFRYCNFKTISLPYTIESIGAEAFAYCTRLTEFTIPYPVEQIAPSTFLDCRELLEVHYAVENSRTAQSLYNYRIKSIGDHAFDSCVKLTSFNCPRVATSFGKSCFQNCQTFTSFSFPRVRTDNEAISNPLTVQSFAFADCVNLNRVYFETNMSVIHDYAFTDCANNLTIDYTGNSIAAFDSAHPNWRRRYIATSRNNSSDDDGDAGHLIKVNLNKTPIREDDRYPGLQYSIVELTAQQSVLLDVNVGASEATEVVLIQGPKKFAVIDGFTAPIGDKTGYYVGGVLELPNKVVDPDEDESSDEYDVLKISRRAFVNHTELLGVSFNENLVQICREAFLGCTNIVSLDFMKCQKLREISHKAFQDLTALTAINLPYCLEYIGDYAFNNCGNVSQLTFSANDTLFIKDAEKGWIPVTDNVLRGTTVPSNSSGDNNDYYIDTVKYKAYRKSGGSWTQLSGQTFGQVDPNPSNGSTGDYYVAIPRLKVIGERAFHKIGYSVFKNVNATVNLIIPESVNDASAVEAIYNHELRQGSDWEVTGGRTDYREVGVGRHAFDRAVCLATVEMAEAIDWGTGHNHKTDSASLDYTCSIGTSAFARCYNLLRFQVSDNFYTIGASCFNAKTGDGYNYFRLKEVFLKSEKACNADSIFKYPFAVGNHNLAGSNGDPLAVGGQLSDLVIYVKGEIPGDLDDYSEYSQNSGGDKEPNNKLHWNAETASYKNTYESNSTRRNIPTYFGVDWQSADGLLYWKPALAASSSANQFVSKPQSAADYIDNRVVLVKQNSKYVVSRYYCNTSTPVETIDLSKIPTVNCTSPATINAGAVSNLIETIGICAFGANSSNESRGRYIILPETVKVIKERAFFTNTGSYGVRIVTYRNSSDKIVKNDGTGFADDNAFTAICNDNNGYCYLPDGLKTIGRDAFYNNHFKTIRVGANLTASTGEDAIPFGTTPFVTGGMDSYVTSITFGSTTLDMRATTDTGTWVNVPCFEGVVSSSNPASPRDGDEYYKTGDKKVYRYTNGAWAAVAAKNGDYFINTDNNDLYKYTSSWAKVTPDNSGSSAPSSVTGTAGQNYLDTTNKLLYIKSNGSALYYDDTSGSYANKTLVYEAGGNTGLLRIEDGTKVIGKQAVARSKYHTVYIPNSVTTLYGSCFSTSSNLRTVLGGEGIQYINSSQDPEKWTNSLPFDMIDDTTTSMSNTYTGAFSGCAALMYFDFTKLTSLKKIGASAFSGCTSLSNMTGGKRYFYYRYTSSHTLDEATKDVDRNHGVLDLSYCTSLTNIYGSAFNGCTSLKYVHTPKTVNRGVESKLTIADDAFKSVSNADYLIGETASQADNNLSNNDGGLNTSKHYSAKSLNLGTNKDRYYYVDSAVITLYNTVPNNSNGRDNDFCIVKSSDGVTNTVYQKQSGAWVTISIANSTTSNPGTSNSYNVGDYWLNTTSHVLFTKVAASKWQVVGDIPLDETDDGEGNYSASVRSYWTYDSANNRYILFPKGNKAQSLVKSYFYYGVAS